MDKELLFKDRLTEDDVTIPGVGTVRVRALSRYEVMLCQQIDGPRERERRILALGLVDPRLTEAEAERWMKGSPAGEIEPVSMRIAELSGLLEDSAKAAYKSDGPRPVDGVRVVPGAEAVDDAGPATG